MLRAPQILDFLYPILNVLCFGWIYLNLIFWVKDFYATYLPFLNTRLLDQSPEWLQAVGGFMIYDLMLYTSHFVQHKIRWCWHFHTVHHSAEELNPLTANRIHWLEYVMDAVIHTLPLGIVGGDLKIWFALGLFNTYWGYVVHSKSDLNIGPLAYIIVTPQYHRIHHSKKVEHYDKNFAERLTLWDFVFGTICFDFDSVDEFGLREFPVESERRTPIALFRSWWTQTMHPFRLLSQDVFGKRVMKNKLRETIGSRVRSRTSA